MENPSQSFSISLHGDTFRIVDTSGKLNEHGLPHSLYLPADANGLRLLKTMLRAKNINPHGKLGTNARLTQELVNEFLKNQKLEKENIRQQDLNEIASMF